MNKNIFTFLTVRYIFIIINKYIYIYIYIYITVTKINTNAQMMAHFPVNKSLHNNSVNGGRAQGRRIELFALYVCWLVVGVLRPANI